MGIMKMAILIGSFTCICLGYGGFFPRTHELFGKDYEHVTHDALNLLTDERKKQEMVLTTPVSAVKTCIFRLTAMAHLYNLLTNSVRNGSNGDYPSSQS